MNGSLGEEYTKKDISYTIDNKIAKTIMRLKAENMTPEEKIDFTKKQLLKQFKEPNEEGEK